MFLRQELGNPSLDPENKLQPACRKNVPAPRAMSLFPSASHHRFESENMAVAHGIRHSRRPLRGPAEACEAGITRG